MDAVLYPRVKGRASQPLAARVVRELVPEDLVLLQTERGTKPIPLQKLRDSHHWLARLLADGVRPIEASKITGYGLSRISNLQADAKFRELMAYYRKNTEEIYADAHERMFTLSLEALAILQERLHDAPEQLSSMGLLEIVKTLCDRTGYGPTSKSTLTTINIDLAGRLDRARARVAEAVPERRDRDDPISTAGPPHRQQHLLRDGRGGGHRLRAGAADGAG